MNEIIDKIGLIDFTFLWIILVELVLLAGIYFWSRKLSAGWRRMVHLVIIVLLVRIVLFQNPLAWYTYHKTLDPEVIGWRQSSLLYDNFSGYARHDSVKMLAIGSSQTGYLYGYGFTSGASDGLAVKTLAGMGPVDLYLYRHEILEYDPEKVLLYLSDFDIAREAELDVLKLSPSQGLALPDLLFKLKSNFTGRKVNGVAKELLAGELFPEFKYAFVFKGYLDQLFNKSAAFPTREQQMSDEEYIRYQFEQLSTTIHTRHIPTNLYFLEEFIGFLENQGIRVVILEGQYHPAAYDSQNLAVKRRVRMELEQLSSRHTNVNFLPESVLPRFEASDYVDAYHVSGEAGQKFMEWIRQRKIITN